MELCKFCGCLGEVALIGHGDVFEVYCVRCGQMVIRHTREEAVNAWNKAQQELKVVK